MQKEGKGAMSSTRRPSSTTDSFKWLGQVCVGGGHVVVLEQRQLSVCSVPQTAL